MSRRNAKGIFLHQWPNQTFKPRRPARSVLQERRMFHLCLYRKEKHWRQKSVHDQCLTSRPAGFAATVSLPRGSWGPLGNLKREAGYSPFPVKDDRGARGETRFYLRLGHQFLGVCSHRNRVAASYLKVQIAKGTFIEFQSPPGSSFSLSRLPQWILIPVRFE